MDFIQRAIGVILIILMFLMLSFIISDISKKVFSESGGFKKFIYYKIRNFFS